MKLLGGVGQVEARFGLHGDGVSLNVSYVHGLRRMNHRHRNLFGCTRWTS
jgi:hypothetical protein